MKNILTVAAAALVVFGFCVAGLLKPDTVVSYSERRALAKPPVFSLESVVSGEYMKEIDNYLLDQFPLRESFRSLKAVLRVYGLRQKGNNGVYLSDAGHLFKPERGLKEGQIRHVSGRISAIKEHFLTDMRVFLAVIPDKSHKLATENGVPSISEDELVSLLLEGIHGIEYIDVTDCLSPEDYYRTDSHWRQERIHPVAQRIAEATGTVLTPLEAYTSHRLYPFNGVYAGQSALPVPPDELVYLTSAATEGAVVTSAEIEGTLPVYTTERFAGMDGYDVFLSGAQAIVTIECEGPADKELILFRDSFGSSLAPLLTGAYSKITLIDLRYVSSSVLSEYVTFGAQDVVFLYSTTLLNNGMLLR